MNYDLVKVIELVHRIDKARALLLDCVNVEQGALAPPMRDVVHDLREIATELDCLKPVDALDAILDDVEKDDPIPAAPGPDYATQKQLDTTRISLVNMIHASQDEFLALAGRVERIEMALPPNDTEPDPNWQRQHLYNQAYLAALPRVIGQWGVDGAAGATSIIATQSMEYLK